VAQNFTHFEEKCHQLWLAELNRVLKPKGLLILSVHGEPILNRCKDEDLVRGPMHIEKTNYEKLYRTFFEYGFFFYRCYDEKYMSEGGLDSEIFGITFISKKYIIKHWCDKFTLLEHDEGAIQNWQDWVVLRKK